MEQCAVPELPRGRKYVGAAAGSVHSILWCDDGQAVAFGSNDGQGIRSWGQCDGLELEEEEDCNDKQGAETDAETVNSGIAVTTADRRLRQQP